MDGSNKKSAEAEPGNDTAAGNAYTFAKELAESYADLLKQKEDYQKKLGTYPHYTLDDAYYLLTKGSLELSERVQASGTSDPVARAVSSGEKLMNRLNQEMDAEFRKDVLEPYLDICEKTTLFEIGMNELDVSQRHLAEQLYVQRQPKSSIVDLQGNRISRRKLERETDTLLGKFAWISSEYNLYRKAGGERLESKK